VRFDSLNKVSTITFLKQPEAQFIPPHEIKKEETQLKGFQWRIKERPSYDTIFLVRNKKKLKTEATIGTKKLSNKKKSKQAASKAKQPLNKQRSKALKRKG